MAQERLTLRKIREILRLKDAGLSNRAIARACKISNSTVGEYFHRAEAAGREAGYSAVEVLADHPARKCTVPKLSPGWRVRRLSAEEFHGSCAKLIAPGPCSSLFWKTSLPQLRINQGRFSPLKSVRLAAGRLCDMRRFGVRHGAFDCCSFEDRFKCRRRRILVLRAAELRRPEFVDIEMPFKDSASREGDIESSRKSKVNIGGVPSLPLSNPG